MKKISIDAALAREAALDRIERMARREEESRGPGYRFDRDGLFEFVEDRFTTWPLRQKHELVEAIIARRQA